MNTEASAARPRLRQFGIAEMLLVIAVVATWVAYSVNVRRIARLETRIEAMRRIAGELVVEDDQVYNGVAVRCLRYPDESWRIWAPEGRAYQLHFATRGIADRSYFPTEGVQTIDLAAGQHFIHLRHLGDSEHPRFVVEVDERDVFDVQEDENWNSSGGSSSSGLARTQRTDPLNKPLVLKRQRSNIKTGSGGSKSPPAKEPVNGLMLWVTVKPELEESDAPPPAGEGSL